MTVSLSVTLIVGPCVIEGRDMALEVAERDKAVGDRLVTEEQTLIACSTTARSQSSLEAECLILQISYR